MGTLTLTRFRRKLRAFLLYEEAGLFQEHWQRESLLVLVIVPSRARRDELFAVARQTLPAEWWEWCVFATVDSLDPERFRQNDQWYWLDGGRRGLVPSGTNAGEP